MDWKEELLELRKQYETTNSSSEEFTDICKKIVGLLIRNNPGSLFKYSPSSLEVYNTILKEKIWFSWINNYNDPFDSKVSFDRNELLATIGVMRNKEDFKDDPKKYSELVSDLAHFIPKLTIDEELLGALSYILEPMINNRDKCICSCFSETPTNILMWSHYADNHNGICVEYTFKDLINAFELVLPVVYSDSKPLGKEAIINKKRMSDLNIDAIYRKASDWSYEEEWRIVKNAEAYNGIKSSGIALPFNAKPKAIYLGCRAELSEVLRLFCTSNSIPIYKMVESEKEYKVIPELLEIR